MSDIIINELSVQNQIKQLDDLQKELEGLRIHKNDINYFSATAMLTQEIKHSAFLAWLFDPNKEHELGGALLQRFVEKLFKYNSDVFDIVVKSNSEILSKGKIDKEKLIEICRNGKIVVATEQKSNTGKRVDLRITLQGNADDKNDKFQILIENKIFTTTHDDQLLEYEKIADDFPDYKPIFVYLTRNGEIPLNLDNRYNDKWCRFDYAEVRNIVEELIGKIKDKSNFPRLDNKNRTKLKHILEDYVAMVNDSVLIENPDVWDKIRRIRKNFERELELISEWQDSGSDALRFCHERVKEIFAGKIHFVMGEVLEENACAFRFYIDDIKDAFDETDGNFGEDTKTPRCYIECTSTYCNIQLLVQKRDEWTPRQIRAIKNISTVKSLPNNSYKLLFQEYFLKKEDRAKKFDKALEEYVESKLQTFVNELEEELKKIK